MAVTDIAQKQDMKHTRKDDLQTIASWETIFHPAEMTNTPAAANLILFFWPTRRNATHKTPTIKYTSNDVMTAHNST